MKSGTAYMRGTVDTVHRCVCCGGGYATRKEAAACSRYEPDIKVGDIVLYRRAPWEVTSFQEDGTTGYILVRAVKEYRKLNGVSGRGGLSRSSLWLKGYCNASPLLKYTVELSEEKLLSLEKRVKAAKKFLALVKQSNGVNDDGTRGNVKKVRLVRGNDRAVKRVPKKSVR